MCELATQEVALIQVLLTDLKNIDAHCVLLCLLPCISEANMTGASISPGQKLAIELLCVAHIDFISVVQSFPGIIRKTNIFESQGSHGGTDVNAFTLFSHQ